MRANVVVIGGGALGSLLAARLAQCATPGAGGRVTLLTRWEEHAAAISVHGGIALEEEASSVLVSGVEVARCAAEVRLNGGNRRPDAILLAVKHGDTQRAAADAAELLVLSRGGGGAEAACVVASLQNGMGNCAIVAAELARVGLLDGDSALPSVVVAQGVTSNGATLVAPGVVRHAGRGATELGISSHSTARDEDAVERLCAALSAAGLDAQRRDDIESVVWEKLAVNASINALTALLRVTNGAVATSPACRSLTRRIVGEVAAVARAEGATLSTAEVLTERALAVAERTATNQSSMLSDVLAARATEVDAIHGAVVRAGAARGVPTPANALLAELLAAAHETRAQRVEAKVVRAQACSS